MSTLPTRAEVLDAYSALPLRSGEPAADLSRDVIACGDEGVREAALALGRDLGRPVVDVDVAAGWLPGFGLASGPGSGSTVSDPTSVLLVASRDTMVAETVREWVAASERHGVPVGFVLAADLAEAQFQVAKIKLAHTRTLSGEDALIDAVNGLCGPPDGLKVARPERLKGILDAPWRLLAIGGHSDLAHLGLGSLTLCGATGPERVDGMLLTDGCDPGEDRCRSTTKLLRTGVPTAGLKAAVVALMGCGCFDLAAGEFPTTNSLCVSTLSGWALAVVSTLGQLSSDFDAVGLLAAHVAEGLSLGEAVQRLNRAHHIPTGYGIALAGDPALRFGARVSAGMAGMAGMAGAVEASGASGGVVTADTVADRLRNPEEALDPYLDIIARCRAVERVRHALAAVSESTLNEDLEDSLEELGRRCDQVQGAAWEAVGRFREALDPGVWSAPDGVTTRLDRAVRRWDEAFLGTATQASGNDIYAALHAYHRLSEERTEGTCPRCGSRVQVFEWEDPESPGLRRVAAECWLCGPMRESAASGVVLAITAGGLHAPGSVIRPVLSVSVPPGSVEPDRPGRLAVVLNDRLTDEAVTAFQAECTLADLPEVTLTIPDDARSDLHPLWAVWVDRVAVSFAGTRLGIVRTAADLA